MPDLPKKAITTTLQSSNSISKKPSVELKGKLNQKKTNKRDLTVKTEYER